MENLSALSMGPLLRSIVTHRGVQTAACLWVVAYVLVLWLAHGALPFDRPAVAGLPFALQMAAPSITLLEVFALMVLVFLLTRRREIPDMAARAPARAALPGAKRSVFSSMPALGQAGGWLVGPALGFRPFSFHIAGSVFGCTVTPQRAEVWVWALYNFTVFALLPYLHFRRRYTNSELNLRSSNRRNDALVILVVLAVESVFELLVFNKNILSLSWHQMLLGAPLTFFVFFVGTVLPTMVLIYARFCCRATSAAHRLGDQRRVVGWTDVRRDAHCRGLVCI